MIFALFVCLLACLLVCFVCLFVCRKNENSQKMNSYIALKSYIGVKVFEPDHSLFFSFFFFTKSVCGGGGVILITDSYAVFLIN